MKKLIKFEVATQSDAEALADIRAVAMRESLEGIGRFNPQRARDRFLSSFIPSFTRIIFISEEKVGFIVVKPDGPSLLLDHLYIEPEHQSFGIGQIVLDEIFKEADKLNLSVRVGALKESDSNNFYKRNGFVLIEESDFDNYYIRHPHQPRKVTPK